MPVNFWACPCQQKGTNCAQNGKTACLTVIRAHTFGISDQQGHQGEAAQLALNPEVVWDLTILNPQGLEVQFKAIDWCLDIFRTGNYDLDDENRNPALFSSDDQGVQLIKRCEGFLAFNERIVFVEIKTNRSGRGAWLQDAREKFEETILSFKQHHPHLSAQIQKPVLANPNYYQAHQNEMVQKRILKDKTNLDFIRTHHHTLD